jgi:hypothetical protein
MSEESLDLYFCDEEPEAESLADTLLRRADIEFPPHGSAREAGPARQRNLYPSSDKPAAVRVRRIGSGLPI